MECFFTRCDNWKYTFLIDSLNIYLTSLQKTTVAWCVIGFSPAINWLSSGNITGLLVAAVCTTIALTERECSKQEVFGGGILMAIVIAIKPIYAPAGAILIQDSRRFAAGVLTMIGLTVLSLLFFGVEIHMEYFSFLIRRIYSKSIAYSFYHTYY